MEGVSLLEILIWVVKIEALKRKIFNFNENNENHKVYPSACGSCVWNWVYVYNAKNIGQCLWSANQQITSHILTPVLWSEKLITCDHNMYVYKCFIMRDETLIKYLSCLFVYNEFAMKLRFYKGVVRVVVIYIVYHYCLRFYRGVVHVGNDRQYNNQNM
jgi:hypothetical protein